MCALPRFDGHRRRRPDCRVARLYPSPSPRRCYRPRKISYGLVALLGLVLVLSRARRLYRWLGPAANLYGHLSQSNPNSIITARLAQVAIMDMGPPAASRHSASGCAGMVTSVGLRPCSGAVLVCSSPILDLRWLDRRRPGNVARHGDYRLGACDLCLCAQGRIAACLADPASNCPACSRTRSSRCPRRIGDPDRRHSDASVSLFISAHPFSRRHRPEVKRSSDYRLYEPSDLVSVFALWRIMSR